MFFYTFRNAGVIAGTQEPRNLLKNLFVKSLLFSLHGEFLMGSWLVPDGS